MTKSVRDLPERIQELIRVREWDMRNPGALKQFKLQKVKKLPSIAVDGKLIFEAIIPDQEELIQTIHDCLQREVDHEKNKHRGSGSRM